MQIEKHKCSTFCICSVWFLQLSVSAAMSPEAAECPLNAARVVAGDVSSCGTSGFYLCILSEAASLDGRVLFVVCLHLSASVSVYKNRRS